VDERLGRKRPLYESQDVPTPFDPFFVATEWWRRRRTLQDFEFLRDD